MTKKIKICNTSLSNLKNFRINFQLFIHRAIMYITTRRAMTSSHFVFHSLSFISVSFYFFTMKQETGGKGSR